MRQHRAAFLLASKKGILDICRIPILGVMYVNKPFNFKKLIVLLLVIAVAAGGAAYYQHYRDSAAKQAQQAEKPEKYTVPPSGDHHVGEGAKVGANSSLPPADATNKVLYAMRDMGYKLETGINYIDYHHEYQKLYGMIESYKSDYPGAKKINSEFDKVGLYMLDLDLKWDLDLTGNQTYVFEEYTPNSGIWPDMIKRHPDVANVEKNGRDLISISGVRTVLIDDLHKQMQSSSHNIVAMYK